MVDLDDNISSVQQQLKILDNDLRKQNSLLEEVVREVNLTNTFLKPVAFTQFHPKIYPRDETHVYERFGSLVKTKQPHKLPPAKQVYQKETGEEPGEESLFYNIYQEIDKYPQLDIHDLDEEDDDYYCFDGEVDEIMEDADEDLIIKLMKEQFNSKKNNEKTS